LSDVLVEMFADLRRQRPPVYDADGWAGWIAAMRQVIQVLPTYDQRWASVVLLADDLAGAMRMPLPIMSRALAGLLLAEGERVGTVGQEGCRYEL